MDIEQRIVRVWELEAIKEHTDEGWRVDDITVDRTEREVSYIVMMTRNKIRRVWGDFYCTNHRGWANTFEMGGGPEQCDKLQGHITWWRQGGPAPKPCYFLQCEITELRDMGMAGQTAWMWEQGQWYGQENGPGKGD